MTPDALKQTEARSYSKGYAAGKRRKARHIATEHDLARERALWQRAMLAAIPFAMQQSNWTRGKVPIKSPDERMNLAADVADAAVKVARGRYRI